MKALHTSDGGSDGCQLDNRFSLIPSRSGLFSSWVMEVPTDRQMSEGSSWKLSPRLRFTSPSYL
ncbi:hypothetical protein HAX54_053109, partial [Datura stramonium]|nr:hypothetical protein [Datura stramonium]